MPVSLNSVIMFICHYEQNVSILLRLSSSYYVGEVYIFSRLGAISLLWDMLGS